MTILMTEESMDKTITDLHQALDALRNLHDLQNGPPTTVYADEWREAMKKSLAILNKYGE